MINTTNHDPLQEGAARVQRAICRDGLAELGSSIAFLFAASLAALKLWGPGNARAIAVPLIAAYMVAAVGIRALSERLRLRITSPRTGYVATPRGRWYFLLIAAVAPVSMALLAVRGLLPLDALLIFLGAMVAVLQYLKGHAGGVIRLKWLGALSLALAVGLALTDWEFLYGVFLWAGIQAAVYAAVGATVLLRYLRLPPAAH